MWGPPQARRPPGTKTAEIELVNNPRRQINGPPGQVPAVRGRSEADPAIASGWQSSPAAPAAATWIAAIHANGDDFAPLGTGIVIDDRRVLTCSHVVPATGTREPLFVAFPKAGEANSPRCRVGRVIVAADAAVTDLAVLVLDDRLPPDVDAAPLRFPRPADLVDRVWWAFGFGGGDPLGNESHGRIGAALGYGWVRLDAESRYHIEPGFSGGGLWSPDYNSVVGIVGQANERGDGRAITLRQAVACFPHEGLDALIGWAAPDAGELALAAWGWALGNDGEAGRHWRPRARGVLTDSEPGHRFRGRTAALARIVSWLERANPGPRALVVTGSPGVGKSAVLGRIVTTADPRARAVLPADDHAVRARIGSVACAVHVKGKNALEVAREIACAASAALPGGVRDLAPALRAALGSQRRSRFNLIIDALDEASTPEEARAIITEIVLPMVETCSDVGAQVVVGTRRRDDGGDLLAGFGRALHIVDLDDPAYLDERDLASYALATLQLRGRARSGNPYNDDAAAHPVAARIAELSDRNFLVAGLVARTHGLHDDEPADPVRLSFTGTVDAALGAYVDGLAPVGDVSARAALTVLALAEPPGWPLDLWRTAIRAITGSQVSGGQLSRFARTSAANFLIGSGAGAPDPAFRLFHQALNDALLRDRERADAVSPRDDARSLSQAFIAVGQRTHWEHVPRYLLRSLPAHADRGGILDDLLCDDDYVLHADLRRLAPISGHAVTPAGRRKARLLQLTPQAVTAERRQRAAMFSVTEALEGLGSAYGGNRPAPYRAMWAYVTPRTERTTLEGHTGPVHDLCTLMIDGRPLLASAAGYGDGTVRIWDPATGEQCRVLGGHVGEVHAVCAFTLGARTLLASASYDKTVRIWDPATGDQQGILQGHSGRVHTVCSFRLGGRTLLASGGGWPDLTVRIWDPATGKERLSLRGHTGPVQAICAFTLNDRVLLASGGGRNDHTIRIWDPATGEEQFVLRGHDTEVFALSALTVDGRSLLASSSSAGAVRLWDPSRRDQIGALPGHSGGVSAVCAVTVDDRVLLATGGGPADATVRLWDPATGAEHRVLRGHTGWVSAVCAFTLGSETMLASAGGRDRTVRLWNMTTAERSRNPRGQDGPVHALHAFALGSQRLLASGGDEQIVRIRDGLTGELGRSLRGHAGPVRAICPLTLGGRRLLASAGGYRDGTVRIWDPVTGEQQRILSGHSIVNALCAFTIGDQALLATGGGTVRIWDPATGGQLVSLHCQMGRVTAMCALSLGDRTVLAVASGRGDGRIQIWNPATPERLRTIETSVSGVTGLCLCTVGGHVALVSCHGDGTLRIWDPTTADLHAVLEGHAAQANGLCLVTLGDRMLLASASDDHTVRIWDPGVVFPLLTIPVHHAALSVGSAPGTLYVGLDTGVLAVGLDGGLFSVVSGADLRGTGRRPGPGWPTSA